MSFKDLLVVLLIKDWHWVFDDKVQRQIEEKTKLTFSWLFFFLYE